MKIKELFETLLNEKVDQDIEYFIMDYLLTLKANNIQKVPTSTVIEEINKNQDVHIDIGYLMKLTKKIPFISDINKTYIELNQEDNLSTIPDTADTVSDMAKSALKRRI